MDPKSLGLPHRAPFVFIDEVVEVEPGMGVRCVKTFADDEPFFAGHFPGNPVVPGVILTESMAQAAGIAGASGTPGAEFLLSAIRVMKFFRAVRPGERVELTARKTAEIGGLWSFEVSAQAGGLAVAEGQIVLALTGS
jgi:3-hydroxyacyl-[acyl-carrier-protein] dehydratase